MRRLILLRHGETVTNREGRYTGQLDVPLTEKGREDAVQAGIRLRSFPRYPDRVYCSFLSRTRETAKLAVPALEPVVLPGIEEANLGILEGKTYREAEALWPEMMRLWSENRDYARFRLPGAETNLMACERALRAVAAVPDGCCALMVTHSTIICALLSALLTGSVDHMLNFDIQNGHMAVFDLTANGARLMGLNL